MNNNELLEQFKKQIVTNVELNDALFKKCDFRFDDSIDLNDDILTCGEKSNYDIYPFGVDSMGGVYGLLNNQYVGYISSEGGCGIIARSVNDFFNLLITCKDLTSFLYEGIFDNIDSFTDNYNEANNEITEQKELYEEFIRNNNFTNDIEKLYEMFKQGITTEPAFTMSADSDNYAPWDDLFYSNGRYIEELRKSKNYLKREDFMNSFDQDKIWSKSMTMEEVIKVLNFMEKELSKYSYDNDKDFVMDGRRYGLMLDIKDRLANDNSNENVLESLFNFLEFVNNEYCSPTLDSQERLHLSGPEIQDMWLQYANKGIICLEEKNAILEMIQTIKKSINKD